MAFALADRSTWNALLLNTSMAHSLILSGLCSNKSSLREGHLVKTPVHHSTFTSGPTSRLDRLGSLLVCLSPDLDQRGFFSFSFCLLLVPQVLELSAYYMVST